MTTSRRDPSNQTPFGAWVQTHPELESTQYSLSLTDVDFVFHKYKTSIDQLGTREVQLQMIVEVKTHGAMPSRSQIETLYDHHQLLCTCGKRIKLKRPDMPPRVVWHFGVYILQLHEEIPEDRQINWGMFNPDGKLEFLRGGSVNGLIQILRFDRRPDNPSMKLSLRRHHRTDQLLTTVRTSLGFDVPEYIIQKS